MDQSSGGKSPNDELQVTYFKATRTTNKKFKIKFTMDVPATGDVVLVDRGRNGLAVKYSYSTHEDSYPHGEIFH